MWTAADVSSQIAGYGPLIVATSGMIAALIAGLSRRDKAQESRATRLDAAADTALSGLQAAYDRAEAERARWETAATHERELREAAEARAAVLEMENARLRRDPPATGSRRATGR